MPPKCDRPFLLNTLIGAGFGAILGVVHSSALSLSMGTGLQMITIIGGVINGGIFGFLLSISVVIVRAIMLSAKTESFAGRLSGMAMAGVIFATALFGFTVYGELTLFSKMKTSAENATGEFKDMSSTEGLQVQNSSGYIDTVNSDLVLTGVVENATDGERHAWYLVADVYDAQGAVLIRAKMLNGKQLYSGRDYEILARRGVNVQELQVRSLKDQGTIIPPRGMVNFELRIMEPPVGIASFIVTLQPFDPIQMFKEMAEELKEKQPQQ